MVTKFYTIQHVDLTSIANHLRSVSHSSTKITYPNEFISTIPVLPSLYSATIFGQGEYLYINDDLKNGNKVVEYIILNNGDELTTTKDKIIDLSKLISDKNAHTISVVCSSYGFKYSEQSNELTYEEGFLPNKGDFISLNLGNTSCAYGTLHLYRVLKREGSIVHLLAMYEPTTSQVFGTSSAYKDSSLDKYLNETFYNTLSDSAKAAIIDKDVNQYSYSYNSSYYNSSTHASYVYYASKTTYANVGTRHIFALDVEDVEKYFNGTDSNAGTFSQNDLQTLFYNTTYTINSRRNWLRSYCNSYTSYPWIMDGESAHICSNNNHYSSAWGARPSFYIDVSKIEFKYLHTISSTLSNCSIIGETIVENNSSATLCICPNKGYTLPLAIKVITDEEYENYSYDHKTGKLIINNITEDITIEATCNNSNQIEKGKEITIENNKYKVLECSGNQAKLLGMFDASTSQKFGSSGTYNGSTLDTYLNVTWLSNQSETLQDAILYSSINIDSYNSGSSTSYTNYEYQYNWQYSKSYINKVSTVTSLIRNVYALGIQDIYDYYEDTKIRSGQVDLLLTNSLDISNPPNYYIWLTSAYSGSTSYAWSIDGSSGSLTYSSASSTLRVRPVFIVDLSKITYSLS